MSSLLMYSFHVCTWTLAVVLEEKEQSKVVMENQDQSFTSFPNENTTHAFNTFKTPMMTWLSPGKAVRDEKLYAGQDHTVMLNWYADNNQEQIGNQTLGAHDLQKVCNSEWKRTAPECRTHLQAFRICSFSSLWNLRSFMFCFP